MTQTVWLACFNSQPFSHTAHDCYPTFLTVFLFYCLLCKYCLKSLRSSEQSEQVFVLSRYCLIAKLGHTQQTQAEMLPTTDKALWRQDKTSLKQNSSPLAHKDLSLEKSSTFLPSFIIVYCLAKQFLSCHWCCALYGVCNAVYRSRMPAAGDWMRLFFQIWLKAAASNGLVFGWRSFRTARRWVSAFFVLSHHALKWEALKRLFKELFKKCVHI